MDVGDVVDPGDAAIQALAALAADHTRDEEKRDTLIDFMLTASPLAEWPADWREILLETCQFVKILAEDLGQRNSHDRGDFK